MFENKPNPVILVFIVRADPASEFDRCNIRLLKDHHIFSSSKCPREGGGGGGSYIS